MANTKITKRMVLNGLLDGTYTLEDSVVTEYILHEISLLDNRKKSDKPTKKSAENESIKSVIVDCMATLEEPKTVTEIQTAFPELGVYSNQKLSSLLRQLVLDGTVQKSQDGKKSLFTLS